MTLSLEQHIKFWKGSASENWRAAESLFELGHYDMSLFCLHLTVEKYLKGLILLRTKQPPPYIHNLNRLAQIAKLSLEKNQEKLLEEISEFNIQARYPEIKYRLYKKATKIFTKKYLKDGKELLVWLQKQYQ